MSLRPLGLLIAATIEILLGVFYGYFGISEVVKVIETPITSAIIHASVQVFLAVAFLTGGIGIFLLKEWGRRLNLVIAVIFGLYALFSLVGILVSIFLYAVKITIHWEDINEFIPFLLVKFLFFILSALLFYYLTRPAVREAFVKPAQT